MAPKEQRLRVATYNVHKCRGLDRRVRPERVAEVLGEIDADIVALQEVVSRPGAGRVENQSAYIAERLGLHFRLGSNRQLHGGEYGNVVLSRFPMPGGQNFSLSVPEREPRGCLRTDVELDTSSRLHIFNVHLGTSFRERRLQAKMLVDGILDDPALEGPRIVLGDFNEWTRGLASRLLEKQLKKAHGKASRRWGRTYPGVLPVLELDHLYHDRALELEGFRPHRSPLAFLASDHLPLVADFRLETPPQRAAA